MSWQNSIAGPNITLTIQKNTALSKRITISGKNFTKKSIKSKSNTNFEDFHETERILYYIDLEARKKKMKDKIRRIKRTRDSLYKDSIAKIQPVVYGDSISTVVSDSIPN